MNRFRNGRYRIIITTMDETFWSNLQLDRLIIDGSPAHIEIDQGQIGQYYLPIACRLIEQRAGVERLLVGIAGPPGSGKSTFASVLSAVVDASLSRPSCVVVGMDGWHFPNTYLVSHNTLMDGKQTPLRQLKGIPESFDHASLSTFLEKIRRETTLSYPVYSREIHEPVSDAGRIEAHHHYILVEGNYLLLDRPPWSRIAELFDYTIFLRAPRPALLKGLRERHLRGGKSEQETARHLLMVDERNIDLVLADSLSPDLLVEKADNRRIAKITFRS